MTAGRWWQRPPGPVFHLALLVALGLLLWAGTEPVLDVAPALVALALLLALAVVWAVRLVLALTARRRGLGRFALAPVLCGAVAVLLLLGTPLDVRWSLDRTAFATAAATGGGATGQHLGTHDVGRVRDLPGRAVAFDLSDAGFLDDVGYAYLPDGPSGEVAAAFESVRFTHLDGSWWTYAADW